MTSLIKLKKAFVPLLLSAILILGGCAQSSNPGGSASNSENSPADTQYFCAQYPGYTLPEAVAQASTIVYAEIANIKPAYEETYDGVGEPSIVTPIDLSPIEPLKGKNDDLVYHRLGGDFKGIRYRQIGDDTHLQPGQKVIAFLNAYDWDISPEWVLLEDNGTIRYQPDPTENYTTVSTEEFLSLIRQELASSGESQ